MFAYLPSTLLSVLAHGLLLFLVLRGWDLSHPPEPIKPPNYIKATLIDVKALANASAPKETKKPPKIDLQKKRTEQERQRQKAAEEAARKKQIALEKAKKEKAEAEKRKQQEELKRQAEREKQALEKQRLEDSLVKERERLEAEQKAEELAQQAEADEQLAQSFVMLIRQRIEENWSRPPSARNDMETQLTIQMIPTGEMIDVAIKKSSGNLPFDRAAVQAVKKTRQIPEIKEMPSRVFEQQFRQFTLQFRPGDLRQ